ncbi:MAG: hypothetical protein M0002_03765 [Rhodospirillales bacterium]|nr:hypothetical protein [Rhodospirillales bacterium]
MEVSHERIEQVVDVRIALETRAALAALRLGRHLDGGIASLEHALAELSLMAARRDAYGFPAAKAVIEAPYSHTFVTGLSSLLVGENPLETTCLWNRMYGATLYYDRGGALIQAMAGIDIALWDIQGKAPG